ncbi:hypothetical protein L249_2978 [Ophiocordyceps polyrhachis-furcata BCC 54312]|uniref:Mitochondrial import inner membrane translocase subunit TIM23 n=1 Tax=Ophiocordyceps polyrhachis-furcata BCC 54312 TaxID=1330021 RepID=A0A367LMV6_9HYPO|nr:hypothetical protein L249_2978 [Ophiocordyceps polyrhachis-furcata BCC 54312]
MPCCTFYHRPRSLSPSILDIHFSAHRLSRPSSWPRLPPTMSSLWNALTGTSKSSQTQAHPQGQSQSLPPTGLSEPAEASSFAVSLTPGTDAYLQSSTFADPSLLHPLAGLDKGTLEYLTLDESVLSDLPGGQSVLPSRGFTDDLCYGTGITYLTALSIGGAWGLQEGLRRSDGQPPKLRLNSVLNAVTRRGPFLGNSAGAVAITYNCINSLIGYVRGKHAASNSVLAGALSGMVFKSTRGLRPMMISGGIVGSVAAVWAIFRRSFFPVPDRSVPQQTFVGRYPMGGGGKWRVYITARGQRGLDGSGRGVWVYNWIHLQRMRGVARPCRYDHVNDMSFAYLVRVNGDLGPHSPSPAMCLPCFPWTWTQYDDPLDSLPQPRVWKREGSSWALVKAPCQLPEANASPPSIFSSHHTPPPPLLLLPSAPSSHIFFFPILHRFEHLKLEPYPPFHIPSSLPTPYERSQRTKYKV